MEPRFTFSDMYGAGSVVLAVPSDVPYGFLPPPGRDWVGRMAAKLGIVGSIPVFCHADLQQKRWLDFHRDAGLPPAPCPLPYHDDGDLKIQIQEITVSGRRIALDYLYPPGVIPDHSHRVDRALTVSLNNKANLGRWAAGIPIPPRKIHATAEVFCRLDDFLKNGPVFIKGVSDGPSGGGVGVCRVATPADAHGLRSVFSSCPSVVVEEARPYSRSFCLNYAVFGPGDIHYLGAGEQVLEKTAYAGSWFDPAHPPPAGSVRDGATITQRASVEGYVGIAGLDVGVFPGGAWEFLDLNFRQNGSTPALLFLPWLRRHLKTDPVARLCSLTPPTLTARGLRFLLKELDHERVFTLSAYAPDTPALGPARTKLLIVGSDRTQVRHRYQYIETSLLDQGK